jgi:hypothetical protein
VTLEHNPLVDCVNYAVNKGIMFSIRVREYLAIKVSGDDGFKC